MYGVTQTTYNGWRKKKSRPRQSVRSISKAEAYELYESEYWKAAGCHNLPWPISYLVFDGAVNSGVKRSVQWLQTALGLKADGVVCSRTKGAAEAVLGEGNTSRSLSLGREGVV